MDNEMSVRPNLYRADSLSGIAAVVDTTTSLAGRDLAPATTSAPPGSAMNSFQRYAMVAGRILVAMIFMMNALNIIGQTLAAHEMAAHGVPASLVPALIVGARALQLIAGLGLILGIYPRISAFGLLLFLIPATLMAHNFWTVVGTPLYPVQLINFFKNVCMAGGLIFILATKSQPVLLPRPTHADRVSLPSTSHVTRALSGFSNRCC
jgi:putative oxidoreductase